MRRFGSERWSIVGVGYTFTISCLGLCCAIWLEWLVLEEACYVGWRRVSFFCFRKSQAHFFCLNGRRTGVLFSLSLYLHIHTSLLLSLEVGRKLCCGSFCVGGDCFFRGFIRTTR